MDFVKGLDDAVVESASRKAFAALPDLSRAITELTVLKGVGPATASAVLAAYAPDVAPFMSDEVGLLCKMSSTFLCISLRVDRQCNAVSLDGLCAGDGSGLGQCKGVHTEAVPCIC